ncbi:MAG: TetR family transcriptional regulator [Anaerolineaceae bacterium]|nr:TetR family transcriptional regulator [Anaerolineaceae bacterium]
METKQGSRQVQRTRQHLEDACIALILEKGYEAVTVQDILDRANVGRSTFYSHYQDKEALLMSRFKALQQAFEEHAHMVLELESFDSGDSQMVTNLPMMLLKYVEQEHRLFKALLGKHSGGNHLNYQREYLLKYARIIFKRVAKAPLTAYELEAVSQSTVSSFLSMLVWWIDDDMPCSTEVLFRLVMRLIEPGLVDVLGIPSLPFARTPIE